MKRILTTEEFIQKSIKIHENKYDYSLVEYKKSTKKIKIICQIHGIFEQTPNSHLSCRKIGSGCPLCNKGGNQLTLEKFIKKAIKKHGDKYDYSLVDYKNTKIKIKIICPKHGEFLQTPNGHLCGNGCSKCGKCLTTDEFIELSRKKHGDKYDYSLVEYRNNKTKVKIICKEHGEFFQKPSHHLHSNCPKCSLEKNKRTKDEFIENSKKKHGNKYDYSLVNIINGVRVKVKIICPKHGIFLQSPDNHQRKRLSVLFRK